MNRYKAFAFIGALVATAYMFFLPDYIDWILLKLVDPVPMLPWFELFRSIAWTGFLATFYLETFLVLWVASGGDIW